MKLTNVIVTDETTNGDYAILARADEDGPWTQVEATKDQLAAQLYAQHIDDNEDARLSEIESCEDGGRSFGDSAYEGDLPNVTVFDLEAQVGNRNA